MSEQQPADTGEELRESTDGPVQVTQTDEEWVRERVFTQQVMNTAQHFGWRPFHLRDRDSRHIVRGRGFPDLVMFRKDPETGQTELVVAELKSRPGSEPDENQKTWLEALDQHVFTRTWRPEHWDEIERVLRNGPANVDLSGETEPRFEPRRSVGQIPLNFGIVIAGLLESIEDKEMDRGERAGLRRMDPENPGDIVFWRLMARDGMPREPDIRKWGLITHGIALMAHGAGLAHNGRIPVGEALYRGGGKRVPFYSNERLSTLLLARGRSLHQLLARLFRMLANDGCSFNWREMAWFILNEGEDEGKAEEARHQIARAYYQAERRSTQAAQAADE